MAELLTALQAASKLGVSRSRVFALIRDGRLKATSLGGIWLIKPKDLGPVKVRPPGRPRKGKP